MAQLIEFCTPKHFKLLKRRWLPLEPRGKIIEFPSAALKQGRRSAFSQPVPRTDAVAPAACVSVTGNNALR